MQEPSIRTSYIIPHYLYEALRNEAHDARKSMNSIVIDQLAKRYKRPLPAREKGAA